VDTLLRNRWWTFAVRAVAAALFGSMVLARQDLSLVDFSRWFGVAAVANGLLALAATVVRFDAGNPWGDPNWDGTPTYAIDPSWRSLAAEAVMSFVTGAVVLVTPITGERALFGLIAGWAVATGIAQALTAGQLQRLATGWQAMAFAAVVCFAAGLTLVAASEATATARMTVVASAALIEAAMLAAIAGPLLRSWRDAAEPVAVQVPVVVLVPARSARR
jgi:uncharacterized membrane protein HdeD (DUF308 family)